MSSHFTPFTLKDISRPGGGFAMLAVDQREAMRLMFAAAGQPKPIADSVLTDFKVAATRILSPYASAVLADKQFCLEQIVEQGAVAKEGANKQVISSQADSLIKISRIWADFFPANTSNQPI